MLFSFGIPLRPGFFVFSLAGGDSFQKEGAVLSAKRFKTAADLEAAWEAYKQKCDSETKISTEFNQRSGQFVTSEIPSPITYTILGFCIENKISRQNFYADYADNPKYRDIVTRMEDECEQDARSKFEKGVIPSQLSGLWMSKHGYTTKTDTNVSGAVPVVISGGDGLED